MTIKEIIAALGGDRAVAADVGVGPSAVRSWIYNRAVPAKHHKRIVELGQAAGLAVSSWDLDPSKRIVA